VFEQQQHVADPACFAQFNKFLLKPQALRVSNRSELDDRNHLSDCSAGASPAKPALSEAEGKSTALSPSEPRFRATFGRKIRPCESQMTFLILRLHR
jgi:hypothetical protein